MIRRLLIDPQQAHGVLGSVLREIKPTLASGQRLLMRVDLPTKKRIQENKYHAQIDDIAKQTTYIGRSWSALHMKRILIDEFADEMRKAGTPLHHDSLVIPSEDGRRIIQLEIHSSEFYVAEASAFIEFLYGWGAERGVKWSEQQMEEA